MIDAGDLAPGESTHNAGCRGLARTILVHKIAGASAKAGADLATVDANARSVADPVRTTGVAFSASTVPAAGQPGGSLAMPVTPTA